MSLGIQKRMSLKQTKGRNVTKAGDIMECYWNLSNTIHACVSQKFVDNISLTKGILRKYSMGRKLIKIRPTTLI